MAFYNLHLHVKLNFALTLSGICCKYREERKEITEQKKKAKQEKRQTNLQQRKTKGGKGKQVCHVRENIYNAEIALIDFLMHWCPTESESRL